MGLGSRETAWNRIKGADIDSIAAAIFRPITRFSRDSLPWFQIGRNSGPGISNSHPICSGGWWIADSARFNLRTMLEEATGFYDNHEEGRFVVETTHDGRPWAAIVEPSPADEFLIVVTAYPLD